MRVKQALLRAIADRLRPALREHADPLVRAELGERRQAVVLARAEIESVRAPLRALERGALAALPRFDRRPLGPDLTVHAAHARDPRVRAVFARHGLPDCPSCPVGADETLAEAAFSEGFDVHALLEELREIERNSETELRSIARGP